MSSEWTEPSSTTAASSTSVNIIHDSVATSDLYSLSSNVPVAGSNDDASMSDGNGMLEYQVVGAPTIYGHTPMLASSCPGFVCYAEKSQARALPYISTTKSAQQIIGIAMRNILVERGIVGERGCSCIHAPYMPPCRACLLRGLTPLSQSRIAGGLSSQPRG
jgi:hypothetical protein